MCKRTGFSRRFTPKNPVRLHNPFGELPRWGAKNVLPLNLIALPARGRLCPSLFFFHISHMRVFALMLWGKRYSRIVAFPIGEGGPRQRWIGCSRLSPAWDDLSSLFFIPLEPYPARSARHLPHAGNAVKLRWIHRVSCFFSLSTWEVWTMFALLQVNTNAF